jgi:hypothetical protein
MSRGPFRARDLAIHAASSGKSLKAPSQALGVVLPGFRKLDDLPSERLMKWIGVRGWGRVTRAATRLPRRRAA